MIFLFFLFKELQTNFKFFTLLGLRFSGCYSKWARCLRNTENGMILRFRQKTVFLGGEHKPLKTLKWRQSDSKTYSGLVSCLTRLQIADVLCVAVATATLEWKNNWKVLRSLQQSCGQTLITALRISIEFWKQNAILPLAPLNVFFFSIFFFSISVRSDFLT